MLRRTLVVATVVQSLGVARGYTPRMSTPMSAEHKAVLRRDLALIPKQLRWPFYRWAKRRNGGDCSRAAMEKFMALPEEERSREAPMTPTEQRASITWQAVAIRELGLKEATANLPTAKRRKLIDAMLANLADARRAEFERIAAERQAVAYAERTLWQERDLAVRDIDAAKRLLPRHEQKQLAATTPELFNLLRELGDARYEPLGDDARGLLTDGTWQPIAVRELALATPLSRVPFLKRPAALAAALARVSPEQRAEFESMAAAEEARSAQPQRAPSAYRLALKQARAANRALPKEQRRPLAEVIKEVAARFPEAGGVRQDGRQLEHSATPPAPGQRKETKPRKGPRAAFTRALREASAVQRLLPREFRTPPHEFTAAVSREFRALGDAEFRPLDDTASALLPDSRADDPAERLRQRKFLERHGSWQAVAVRELGVAAKLAQLPFLKHAAAVTTVLANVSPEQRAEFERIASETSNTGHGFFRKALRQAYDAGGAVSPDGRRNVGDILEEVAAQEGDWRATRSALRDVAAVQELLPTELQRSRSQLRPLVREALTALGKDGGQYEPLSDDARALLDTSACAAGRTPWQAVAVRELELAPKLSELPILRQPAALVAVLEAVPAEQRAEFERAAANEVAQKDPQAMLRLALRDVTAAQLALPSEMRISKPQLKSAVSDALMALGKGGGQYEPLSDDHARALIDTSAVAAGRTPWQAVAVRELGLAEKISGLDVLRKPAALAAELAAVYPEQRAEFERAAANEARSTAPRKVDNAHQLALTEAYAANRALPKEQRRRPADIMKEVAARLREAKAEALQQDPRMLLRRALREVTAAQQVLPSEMRISKPQLESAVHRALSDLGDGAKYQPLSTEARALIGGSKHAPWQAVAVRELGLAPKLSELPVLRQPAALVAVLEAVPAEQRAEFERAAAREGGFAPPRTAVSAYRLALSEAFAANRALPKGQRRRCADIVKEVAARHREARGDVPPARGSATLDAGDETAPELVSGESASEVGASLTRPRGED